MSVIDKTYTGQLATLLPRPHLALGRKYKIHAAEETVTWWHHEGGWWHHYPELTALCGVKCWGAADLPVEQTTCVRCVRTRRFREVVAAAPLVGAEDGGVPQGSGLGDGGEC